MSGAEDHGRCGYRTELSSCRIPQLRGIGEAPGENLAGRKQTQMNGDVVPGKRRAPFPHGGTGCALRKGGGGGSRPAGPVEIVAASLEIVALIQLHGAALHRLHFGLAEAFIVYGSGRQSEASALVAAHHVVGDPNYAAGLVGGEELVTADVHQIDGAERPIVLPPADGRGRATGGGLGAVQATEKQSAHGKGSRECRPMRTDYRLRL